MANLACVENPLLVSIMSSLQSRYAYLNRHYEAAWTESFCHCRCFHAHESLIEAAKCAKPHGAGWYVLAVDFETPRELTDAEDMAVNEFRFGKNWAKKNNPSRPVKWSYKRSKSSQPRNWMYRREVWAEFFRDQYDE